MKSEFDALQTNNTWILVSLDDSYHVIGYKWVFKIKLHSDCIVDRLKAQLVAKGFSQEEGIDSMKLIVQLLRQLLFV